MSSTFLYFSMLAVCASLISLSACKKDSAEPAATYGPLTLHFENVVGDRSFSPTAEYTNGAGETYKITTLQYYVSNISLTREDGTVYTMPQDSSYFLVRQSDGESRDIEIPHVPSGNYTRATFNLGVDSMRSCMDVAFRTGDLDILDSATGKSMYWDWNPGYIFYRFEGDAPSAPGMMGQPGGKFYYHVGGFGGKNTRTLNNNRMISLAFPIAAVVKEGRNPEAHILHDVAKALKGPGGTMSFAATPMFHSINAESAKVADNYAQAFVVAHVHND